MKLKSSEHLPISKTEERRALKKIKWTTGYPWVRLEIKDDLLE